LEERQIRLTAVPDLLMFSDWLLVIMCRNNRNNSAISVLSENNISEEIAEGFRLVPEM